MFRLQGRRRKQLATDITAIIGGDRGVDQIGIRRTHQRDTAHLGNSEMNTTSLCIRLVCGTTLQLSNKVNK